MKKSICILEGTGVRVFGNIYEEKTLVAFLNNSVGMCLQTSKPVYSLG